MQLDPETTEPMPEVEPETDPGASDLIPNYSRALCVTTIKAVNKTEREVAHVITTANPDRVGDIVEASGADLANYLRHPVVMADHSYSIDRIIGRAVNLTVDEHGIFARTKYRDTPLGRDAFNLAAEGLGAWSIGFRPISFKAMKDDKGMTKGFRFTKWEMLEYSQVAIPMNPDAVQNALSKGWVSEANIKTFFRVEESAEPVKPAPVKANAEPEPQSKPLPVPTDRQLKRLASLDLIIGGHRVWEQSRHLGE
jgi:HK97 family phage prohead protease